MKSILVVLMLTLFVVASVPTEARVGGGRSMGSRGSRSFSTPAPSRSQGNYNSSRPSQTYAPNNYGGGSSFLRGLGGGIAGGFLGSMLFRGLGGGGMGYGGGGGGIGLLEILLLAGLGFFAYRWFNPRKLSMADGPNPFSGMGSSNYGAPVREIGASAVNEDVVQDQNLIDSFLDTFFKIQAAWMHRDLTPVKSLLAPEIAGTLETDIERCKTLHRINRLENITVRDTELTESWSEGTRDFVTLRIRANVLDYTVDDTNDQVIEGDRNTPTKFEEFWTFVKDSGRNWQLSAIQNP